MKRLTVLSTIALPLIVITGFFGQNFGFLVEHIGSWSAFVVFALVLPVLGIVLLVAYLRRKQML